MKQHCYNMLAMTPTLSSSAGAFCGLILTVIVKSDTNPIILVPFNHSIKNRPVL
jgi:hypothetical protein